MLIHSIELKYYRAPKQNVDGYAKSLNNIQNIGKSDYSSVVWRSVATSTLSEMSTSTDNISIHHTLTKILTRLTGCCSSAKGNFISLSMIFTC
jgi:hypothetical protein